MLLQLILGGARSGKSRYAEAIAAQCEGKISYIATADASQNDPEMAQRVSHHRERRPSDWLTCEAPVHLAATLIEQQKIADLILVDCLTLWLTNCLLADTPCWQDERRALLSLLPTLQTPTIFVSNEVGLGVVPMGELSRRFVDEAGFLNQAVAALCHRVVFTAAGLPMILKDSTQSMEM